MTKEEKVEFLHNVCNMSVKYLTSVNAQNIADVTVKIVRMREEVINSLPDDPEVEQKEEVLEKVD